MKDLKENIQRNNMKKLVLSAVLGMFCYCTNNAMNPKVEVQKPEEKKIKEIDNILIDMLIAQRNILQFKKIIEKVGGKIYSKIKEDDGTVKKGKVLKFIKNRFTKKEQEQEGFDDDIKKIEQYFHLEKIKNDNNECNEENLTEIFWSKEEDQSDILTQDGINIENYFIKIIDTEKETSKAFKKYYKAKKEENKEAQDEEILKEIMQDCCGNEKKDYDTVKNFLLKLGKLYDDEKFSAEDKEAIITTIKKRITLSNDTAKEKEDFIYFLKQKIREEKKEGGCCPCCDCF